MKVIVSPLAEADIDRLLDASVQRFGIKVATSTFLKIDKTLKINLAARPYMGRYLPHRRTYRLPVTRTPFVIYYRVNARAGRVFIVAIRHGAQDRSEFEDA